jgi:hypothetical protein
MLVPNILSPTGSTLLSGAPLAWQSFIAREIVAAATQNGGHIIFLGDDINDGLSSVRAYGNWEKHRQRKSKGPQLDAIAFHNLQSVQQLANTLNSHFAEHDVYPRIVVRDTSRSLSVDAGVWPVWVPLLVRLAPANYLTVCHTGIRGAAVTQNKKPFTATWTLSEDFDPPPAQRFGERMRITDVSTGQAIRLHGHNVPGDMVWDLYEEKKELVSHE